MSEEASLRLPVQEPEYVIHTVSYSPDPVVHFCLNFLGREWFGGSVKGAEALTFAHMIFSLYTVQRQGLLMSKKDVMRAIGAEHVTTAKRYADLGVKLGMLRLARAEMDQRVELVILTDHGKRLVEKELTAIERSVRWATKSLPEKPEEAWDLRDSITVDPPKVEDLTIVNDQLVLERPRIPDPNSPERTQPTLRPRTYHRWIEAHKETLLHDKNNMDALESLCHDYEHVGELDNAIAAATKLIDQDAGRLPRRADLLLKARHYDLAIADIDEFYKRYPEHSQICRATRGEAFAYKRDWKRALEDIDAALADRLYTGSDYRGPADIVYTRGLAHANLGHYAAAIADLEYAKADAIKHLDINRQMFNEPPDWLSIPIEEKEVKQYEALVAQIDHQINIVKSLLPKPRKQKMSRR